MIYKHGSVKGKSERFHILVLNCYDFLMLGEAGRIEIKPRRNHQLAGREGGSLDSILVAGGLAG